MVIILSLDLSWMKLDTERIRWTLSSRFKTDWLCNLPIKKRLNTKSAVLVNSTIYCSSGKGTLQLHNAHS
jgi:hypothetical protein